MTFNSELKKIPEKCPNCGAIVDSKQRILEDPICRVCGFDLISKKPPSTEKDQKKESRIVSIPNKQIASQTLKRSDSVDLLIANRQWGKISDNISRVGRYSWLISFVLSLISLSIGLFLSIDRFLENESVDPTGTLGLRESVPAFWIILMIFGSISLIASVLSIEFSKLCQEQNWPKFYEEVLEIQDYRIPSSLIYCIVLEIFSFGIGGLIQLVILILLLKKGPYQFSWIKSKK